MRYLRGFGRFWWDFVVGDDWRVAIGLILALGLSALLVHESIAAWWLLPVAVLCLLADSLRRATHRS
jgi:arginine exporter protein ArgO